MAHQNTSFPMATAMKAMAKQQADAATARAATGQ
jgi:hypothetical protein